MQGRGHGGQPSCVVGSSCRWCGGMAGGFVLTVGESQLFRTRGSGPVHRNQAGVCLLAPSVRGQELQRSRDQRREGSSLPGAPANQPLVTGVLRFLCPAVNKIKQLSVSE